MIQEKAATIADSEESQIVFTLQLDSSGLEIFKTILNRALNCWPAAPKDWKELSDLLQEGKILQDYSQYEKKINRAATGQ